MVPSVSALAADAFLPPVAYNTGGLDTIFDSTGGPVWILSSDVNADGRPDLLVANWCVTDTCTTSNVGVLLNAGKGAFQPVVTYDTGGYHAFSVSAADMNGDGIPDLVVANGCGQLQAAPQFVCPDGSVGILLGNGDGTFRPVHNFASGGSLSAMVVADLNHDGHIDVVVSNCVAAGQQCPNGNGNVGVLLGNGDGTLQPVQLYDSGGLAANYVLLADVNGDSQPDVLVSNQRVCDDCRGNLGVLLARGDGTFQNVQTYDTGMFFPGFMVTADFNGDQKPDVALTQNVGGGGQLAVLLNRGDGTFLTAADYATGGQSATPLVVGDVNGDGKLDLVLSHSEFCDAFAPSFSCISVLLGIGDGSFQQAVTYPSGATGAWSLAMADFDGDGKLDVAVAHQCRLLVCSGPTSIVGVLGGNGDGTFQAPVTYSTSASSVLVLATDVNGDGRPDLVVGAAPFPTGAVNVLLNNTIPEDSVPPTITAAAAPNVLWPPNGATVPVVVTGTITDSGSGVNVAGATFSVLDEYGQIHPAGAVTIGTGGHYSITVPLQAARRGDDKDGRRYTVTVRAQDNAGNTGMASAIVTVPHDQGH